MFDYYFLFKLSCIFLLLMLFAINLRFSFYFTFLLIPFISLFPATKFIIGFSYNHKGAHIYLYACTYVLGKTCVTMLLYGKDSIATYVYVCIYILVPFGLVIWLVFSLCSRSSFSYTSFCAVFLQLLFLFYSIFCEFLL